MNRLYLLVTLLPLIISANNFNNLGIKGLTYEANKSESFLDANQIIFKDIRIKLDDISIQAKKLTLNYKTKDFIAEGNVLINNKIFIAHSKNAKGNLLKKVYTMELPKIKKNIWRLSSESASISQKQYVTHKVTISSCEKEKKQHYNMVADKVTYTQTQGFKAYNTTFYLNQIPIFYLPYFPGKIGLDDGDFIVRHVISSRWGLGLLSTLPYDVSGTGSSNLLIDFRSKRGLALGNRSIYETQKSATEFLLYGLYDQDSPGTNGFIGKFKDRKERLRVKINHSSTIAPNFYFKTKVDYTSDIFLLNDFFRQELNTFAYSYSHIGIEFIGENFNFSYAFQPRINNFNSVVERLPEFTFSITPHHIANNIYYSQKSTINSLKLNWLDSDLPPTGLDNFEDYRSGRFDTQHFFHYYGNLGHLKFIPRFGIRLISYTASSNNSINPDQLGQLLFNDDPFINRNSIINNYDDNGKAKTLLIPEFGFELNFTSEGRINWQNKTLDINNLTHSITPYINWNYVPQVDKKRNSILFFDETDRIAGNHFIRFGVNQTFSTLYQNTERTVISFNNYLDYFLNDQFNSSYWGDYGFITNLSFNDKWSLQSELLTALHNFSLRGFLIGGTYNNPEIIKGSLTYIKRQNYLSQDRYSAGSTLDNALDSTFYARRYEKLNSIRFELEKKD